MNTPFDANSTGFDRVLDGTRIDTNKTTGQINIAVVPASTLETAVKISGGSTTATLDAAGNFSAASSSASTTSGTTATASDFVGTWKGTMTFTTTNVYTSGSFPAEFVFALSNGLLTGTTIAYGDSAT